MYNTEYKFHNTSALYPAAGDQFPFPEPRPPSQSF